VFFFLETMKGVSADEREQTNGETPGGEKP
jgi:hypothetical protein